MIDVLGNVLGAAAVAVPAASLLAGSVRGLRREMRRGDRLAEALAAARFEATHDGLTGLYNRVGFTEIVGSLLARRDAAPVTVALVDLDRFKPINDMYGHAAGDRVLVAVAGELRRIAGRDGVVGRLGGDEFALAVPAGAVGVLPTVSVPVAVSETVTVEVSASVGVAFADGAADLRVLLGRADAAMYRAKRSGAGTAVYDDRLDDDTAPIPGARPPIRTRDLSADARQEVVAVNLRAKGDRP